MIFATALTGYLEVQSDALATALRTRARRIGIDVHHNLRTRTAIIDLRPIACRAGTDGSGRVKRPRLQVDGTDAVQRVRRLIGADWRDVEQAASIALAKTSNTGHLLEGWKSETRTPNESGHI